MRLISFEACKRAPASQLWTHESAASVISKPDHIWDDVVSLNSTPANSGVRSLKILAARMKMLRRSTTEVCDSRGPMRERSRSQPDGSLVLHICTAGRTRFHFFAAAVAVSITFGMSSTVMDETECKVHSGEWGSRTLYDPAPVNGLPST